MGQDVRYALRTFLKHRSFAAAAIATLALGISVNTVAFSILNSLVLRPMPVPGASRVVRVYPADVNGRRSNLFSWPDFRDYQQQSGGVFETLAGYIPAELTAGRASGDRTAAVPRAALGYVVSASYFTLTGVRPVLGRVLQAHDDDPGSRAAVLGHAFWQRRFAGDPAAVGGTLVLNGELFTIVGVAEPKFAGTEPLVADVWLPPAALSIAVPDSPASDHRDAAVLLMAGRLRADQSRARAAEALNVIASRLRAAYPGARRPAGVQIAAGSFFTLDSNIKPVIAGMLAIVALVLLVACANVANLILARAVSRRRELAVRLALGAARSRIARQLTVEALLLSSLAGIAALLLSTWALRILYATGISLAPFSWTIALPLQPDVRVFGYTFALAAIGGLALGVLPAFQSSRLPISSGLHDARGSAGSYAGGSRLRHGLVVVQVAVSLILLFGAGLLTRALHSAETLDLGFAARGAVYGEYDLRAQRYSPSRAAVFQSTLAERVRAAPGVSSVAFTSHVPLHGGVRRIVVSHGTADPASTIASTVSPEYFATLEIPFVSGRTFDPAATTPAVIISEGLARRFWPGQPAYGKTLTSPGWAAPRTVVGIVRDASNGAIWRDKEMSLYLPADTAADPRDLGIVVRAEPGAAASIESIAASLDPDLRFSAVPLENLLRLWLLPSRVAAAATAVLAGLALLLASIGLYGVLSFAVSHRLREIGIRMALGADGADVVRLVLRDGARLLIIGLALGGVCAAATAPLLGRLLFGVSAFDPLTAIAVPLLLISVGLAASYIPARRAARLEPLIVLRMD